MVPVSNVISTSSSYLQDYELSDGLRRDIVKVVSIPICLNL